MKIESSNLLSVIRSNRMMTILAIALVVLLALGALSGANVQLDANIDQDNLQHSAELRALSFRATALSRDATSGNELAFIELKQVLQEMDETWAQLKEGDAATADALAEELQAFDDVWIDLRANAQTIVDNEDTIIFLSDVATTLNESLPELQAEHDLVVDVLLNTGAPADQAVVAQKQFWRAERIGRNVDKMLRGGRDSAFAAEQFSLDSNMFGKVLTGMRKGDAAMGVSRITEPQAQASLDDISDLFEFVNSSAVEIFDASPALFAARQASDGVLDDSPKLLEALGSITDAIPEYASNRYPNNQTSLALAVLAILALALMGVVLYRGQGQRAAESQAANDRNQMAILTLLDELADLADGDLTASATVSEDFTGAIADSINFTIDQLRELVSRINVTSVAVSSAADKTQKTALELADASELQAREITQASAAIAEMSETIEQVSNDASESAGVANSSVTIANNGSKVVQDTIDGMDTIREQIQDTSKRIKRLGESSQEIGDIVSLISDIADQTNILSLNAAIQASMAGDAGRGFAVVADEVQRLAERSAAATKQIETLVKAIQNDTNEAVISMEQTTSEVVRGARLAQDAGVALGEIETVSTDLASLIQNISESAHEQALSASKVAETMTLIQDITEQTSEGTSATAGEVGALAGMALDLRESVAGFTLPVEMRVEAPSFDAGMATAENDPSVVDLSDEFEEVEALDFSSSSGADKLA